MPRRHVAPGEREKSASAAQRVNEAARDGAQNGDDKHAGDAVDVAQEDVERDKKKAFEKTDMAEEFEAFGGAGKIHVRAHDRADDKPDAQKQIVERGPGNF